MLMRCRSRIKQLTRADRFCQRSGSRVSPVKPSSIIRMFIAAAVLLCSMDCVHGLTYYGSKGNAKFSDHIRGTISYVDRNKRFFRIHWSGVNKNPGGRWGSSGWSNEATFRVTDQTVYKNGSWDDMKKGVQVRIAGQSGDVVDRVSFTK
jgi:hypothetical protein